MSAPATALRYAELNPLRARLVAEATAWPWSSAAHCGTSEPDVCLETEMWRKQWSEATWRKFLEEGERESELRAIRRCTHSGHPLGAAEFIQSLEPHVRRRLTPGKGGRPRKPAVPRTPQALLLAA